MKEKINRLLYLERELINVIHNEITENVARDKETDVNRLRESLIYHIDDHLHWLKQGR